MHQVIGARPLVQERAAIIGCARGPQRNTQLATSTRSSSLPARLCRIRFGRGTRHSRRGSAAPRNRAKQRVRCHERTQTSRTGSSFKVHTMLSGAAPAACWRHEQRHACIAHGGAARGRQARHPTAALVHRNNSHTARGRPGGPQLQQQRVKAAPARPCARTLGPTTPMQPQQQAVPCALLLHSCAACLTPH